MTKIMVTVMAMVMVIHRVALVAQNSMNSMKKDSLEYWELKRIEHMKEKSWKFQKCWKLEKKFNSCKSWKFNEKILQKQGCDHSFNELI